VDEFGGSRLTARWMATKAGQATLKLKQREK
jgi:hypothetical protein